MCHDARVGRHTIRAVREAQIPFGGTARSAHPGVLIAVLAAAGISVSLMQTLIIPLVPELPKLLNTSPTNASWAITVTLLTAAVATPVFGRLGDMYGPKPILIICAATLTAGSMTSALTSSLVPFIVGRGLQGLGMPIIPLAISVLRAAVPADRVGSAMGLISASLGVGGALGLPLSAFVAEKFNWHTLFWCAAGLGLASVLLFVFLVPRIPASSTDRLDPLGTLLLAAGLVTLLLPISKGSTWGWADPTTLSLFATSLAVFTVFAMWQFRTPSPTVDLRTTLERPVLTTNLASIGVGFALFAMSLIGPQILELPKQSGFGLGQSMLHAGLWMAPGGLAMMVSAPIAARIAARRGPRFTLVVGTVIIACSYLAAFFLLGSPLQVMCFNLVISIGVGFAFSSLPALINAAVPVSETAAANGINALARSLGTSVSSAVIGAVLSSMTISLAGHLVPSLNGFRTALLVAAGAAVVATLLALLIPGPSSSQSDSATTAPPAPSDWATAEATEDNLRQLEFALTMLGRHTALGSYSDHSTEHHDDLLDRSSYLLMSRIEDVGAMSIPELAAALGLDGGAVHRQLAIMVRNDLAARVEEVRDDRRIRRFVLTPYGRMRLYRHRVHHIDGLRQVLARWNPEDVSALVTQVDKFVDAIDLASKTVGDDPVTGPIRQQIRG
jgi:MFS family permease